LTKRTEYTCTVDQKSITLKRETFTPKGLRATVKFYLLQVHNVCQHTVHCLKLEKSGHKHQKSRLKKRLSLAQKQEADETMRNA